MSWFALGPIIIPPGCPGPNCGWRHPTTVAILSQATYTADGTMRRPRQTGRLCRCPICTTMYVELGDKVQRCGIEVPKDAAPRAETVAPERKPSLGYPPVPEDMRHAWDSREPR